MNPRHIHDSDSGLFPAGADKDTPTVGGLCESRDHAVAPLLRGICIMTATNWSAASPDADPVLRWIFRRDRDALTCGLEVDANRAYDVCVVPHWDVSSSLIEHFDAPADALFRHAEIARRLRERGWVLTDYVSGDHAAAAA